MICAAVAVIAASKKWSAADGDDGKEGCCCELRRCWMNSSGAVPGAAREAQLAQRHRPARARDLYVRQSVSVPAVVVFVPVLAPCRVCAGCGSWLLSCVPALAAAPGSPALPAPGGLSRTCAGCACAGCACAGCAWAVSCACWATVRLKAGARERPASRALRGFRIVGVGVSGGLVGSEEEHDEVEQADQG